MNVFNVFKYICDKNRYIGDIDNSFYIIVLFFLKDKILFKNGVKGLVEREAVRESSVFFD